MKINRLMDLREFHLLYEWQDRGVKRRACSGIQNHDLFRYDEVETNPNVVVGGTLSHIFMVDAHIRVLEPNGPDLIFER